MSSRQVDDEFDAALLQIDEARHLGGSVEDVEVATASGNRSLAALIAKRPAILLLAYYSCGHTCPLTIQNLAQLPIDMPTSDYSVIVLSFDATDTLISMNRVRSTLNQLPENWTFGLLSAADSERLTQSVGFKYFFSERDQTFVHPAVLIFLSPDGGITRYLYGVEPVARDVKLALIESRKRLPRLNEIVDMVKASCFQFDRSKSRYVLHPTVIFGAAGIGVLALVAVAALAYKDDSRGEA